MASNSVGGEGGRSFHLPLPAFTNNGADSAENAELLAELRAISNKSGGSRFADEVGTTSRATGGNNEDDDYKAHNADSGGKVEGGNVNREVENKWGSEQQWESVAREGRAGSINDGGVRDSSSVAGGEKNDDGDITGEGKPVVVGGLSSCCRALSLEGNKGGPIYGADGAMAGGFRSYSPKTFADDRGGSAEDAALLEELRAISNKPSSNRFDGEGDAERPAIYNSVGEPTPAAAATSSTNAVEHEKNSGRVKLPPLGKKRRPLPPWKQKGASKKTAVNDDVNIVVAAPTPSTATTKSEGKDEGTETPGSFAFAIQSFASKEIRIQESASSEVLGNIAEDEVEEMFYTPRETESEVGAEQKGEKDPKKVGFRINSDLPKTFAGERGGAAKDTSLLTELRAISNKSSVHRFDGDDGGTGAPTDDVTQKENGGISTMGTKKGDSSDRPLPPWKRKGSRNKLAASNDMDVGISALPAPKHPFQNALLDETTVGEASPREADDVVETQASETKYVPRSKEGSIGIKSDLPNTFTGSRGGSAEDAELLAELRAVSIKSSSNRFSDDDDRVDPPPSGVDDKALTEEKKEVEVIAPEPTRWDGGNKDKKVQPLPPWKRKGAKKRETMNDEDDIVVASAQRPLPTAADCFYNPLTDETRAHDASAQGSEIEPSPEPMKENIGMTSSLPKTFRGEWGGPAKDADLLTGLRAISMKSSSNRFDGDDDDDTPLSANKSDVKVANKEKSNKAVAPKPNQSVATTNLKALPPWKRKRKGAREKAADNGNVAVVVAAPTSSAAPFRNVLLDETTVTMGNKLEPSLLFINESTRNIDGSKSVLEQRGLSSGIKSSLPNTLKGDRGGAAEDAGLLAELRSISMKSSTNRFDDDSDNHNTSILLADDAKTGEDASMSKPKPAEAMNDKPKQLLPPWKQKGAKEKKNAVSNDDANVVVAAPPASAHPFRNALSGETTHGIGNAQEMVSNVNETGNVNKATSGIKSSLQSTFKGDQGDAAKDARRNGKAHMQDQDKGNMGIKSSLPNTFTGSRGGSAEDAELLAALRAVSMKSSTNRFNDDLLPTCGDDDTSNKEKKEQEVSAPKHTGTNGGIKDEKVRPLPSWKRKAAKNKTTMNDCDDIAVACPQGPPPAAADPCENPLIDETTAHDDSAQVSENEPSPRLMKENIGITPSLPNTFRGNRGGAAEDADLLAELRAISTKLSGNRFDNDDNVDTAHSTNNNNVKVLVKENVDKTIVPKPNNSTVALKEKALPPWKRKGAREKAANNNDVEVVVAAPTVSSDPVQNVLLDGNTQEPSTSLFNESKQNIDGKGTVIEQWEERCGIESSLLNTSKGDWGGPAEDADLLSELRSISMKSSTNRFDDSSDNHDTSILLADDKAGDDVLGAPKPHLAESMKDKPTQLLPPWKRKGAKKKKYPVSNNDAHVIVAAPPAPSHPFRNASSGETTHGIGNMQETVAYVNETGNLKKSNFGIKSSQPNTFKGDLSGAVEDADLLVELCSISNKSSTNRFEGEDDNTRNLFDDNVMVGEDVARPKPKQVKVEKVKAERPLPPLKRKVLKKANATVNVELDAAIAAPPAPTDPFQNTLREETADKRGFTRGYENEPGPELVRGNVGIKSSLPNTFRGDRGGSAEDAELLAELRLISMKSSSNRFNGNGHNDIAARSENDDSQEFTKKRDDSVATARAAMKSKTENTIKAEKLSLPLPPWKRAVVKKSTDSSKNDDLDVVVADPTPASLGLGAALEPVASNDVAARKYARDGTIESDGSGAIAMTSNELREEDMGIKLNLPNTFKGDWRGSVEDMNILADLRAISMKSSTNRFDVEETEADGVGDKLNCSEMVDEPKNIVDEKSLKKGNATTTANKDASSNALPPWKRKFIKKKKSANSDESHMDVFMAAAPPRSGVDIQVTASDTPLHDTQVCAEAINYASPPKPQQESMGIKSNLPSTFKGERGGSALDADLLAELRAISMNSSTNRFNGEKEDDTGPTTTFAAADKPDNPEEVKPWSKSKSETSKVVSSSKAPPPWKRKSMKRKQLAIDDAGVVVIAAPQSSASLETNNEADDVNEAVFSNVTTPDGVVAVAATTPQNESMGIKSNLPNTFKGDRGGAAEDADLLAELRSISMKTSSSRFDVREENAEADVTAATAGAENIENANESNSSTSVFEKPWKKKSTNTKSKGGDISSTGPRPPWKRNGARATITETNAGTDVFIVTSFAPPADATADHSGNPNEMNCHQASNTGPSLHEENMGIKPNLPNTFEGDRGGSAEDADLLAELRAISVKSSSNRFDREEDETGTIPSQGRVQGTKNASKEHELPGDSASAAGTSSKSEGKQQENQNVPSSTTPGLSNAFHSQGTATPSTESTPMGFGGISPAPPSSADAEINITLEVLDESLKSPSWQLRKASYLFLHDRITSLSLKNDRRNLLNGDEVFSSLDGIIPNALKDKNAGALDAALSLVILYVGNCQGVCSDGAASRIMISLLKGASFTSSRSSTLRSTEELVLKLIEVAPEGSSSINDIFDLIQEHGLKSRKPKAVLFSAKLILKAVHTFGACVLPIPKLCSHSEALIAHSNAQAREVGIQLLAEVCRALGSKSPLQNVVDKLKSSQLSSLDSLLAVQPSPTVPTRRLRSKMGESVSTQSPEEALAALKKSQEEDEARRLAERPAINLFQVLPNTCYKEKIKLEKWSEKVAALDALIEAGGEQPYKICPPSSSVNYTPLVRELRQLLSHTHFAVCSKALAALSMLAEGAGEQLFSSLRPLLPTLLALFKDKKVGNAVGSCLDKMFANVFGFEHLLDSNDSLPSSLDEKKEKNALVRKSILEYLGRCVTSNGAYGTRGDITCQNAKDLSKLACEKLKDSDAATRKAATNVLLALLKCKDESVVSATQDITSSLESSNPRAYKSLKLASTGGDKKIMDRPQSAPAKASAKTSKQQPSSKGITAGSNSRSKSSVGPPRPPAPAGATEENYDEKLLPSLEDSIENLSALAIPKWGDDIDEEGVLAGIQSSNWKARMGALNQLVTYYRTADGGKAFNTFPSLFVLVRECTKSLKESNFNVAKALLELFITIFDVHAQLRKAPESHLYISVTKFSVEKVGDRKLCGVSSLCLNSICTVKDPQRVLAVAVRTVDNIKSPLVHEALLGWFKTFCIDFGAASLSKGIQDCLIWVLKECESKNTKVKKSALVAMGVLHSQLGPVLQAFVKSKDVQATTLSLIDKAFSDNPHDTNAQSIERKVKCVTLPPSGETSHQGSSQPKVSSILSLPTTDLVASLKSDCLSRINTAEGKNSWKLRKEAMEEVKLSLSKCGGRIASEGKAFSSLKKLFMALRLRLNDSQSNLKPVAAILIGLLLNRLDDEAQAKLGKIVFPALANAAMNDMKKTMRDAAVSALSMGTERSKEDGGGTNLLASECFIACLESELSGAALKSLGLPDVLIFLTQRLESFFSAERTESSKVISVDRELAKVIVLSLLSSKAGTRSAGERLLALRVIPSEVLDKEIGRLLPAQARTVRSFIPKLSTQEKELVDTSKRPPSRSRQPVRPNSSGRQLARRESARSHKVTATASTREVSATEIIKAKGLAQNPLHPGASKLTKLQRLSFLGRSDNWPEYPEEPSSDATLQSLRKAWSLIISSSSIQLLFPKDGFRSHEDAVKGCDIISRSMAYSRNSNDISFLEQLDFIFKWVACALFSRDHTSGLRSLLSTIQLLYERLHELSYVINDAEANILFPFIFEKAGVAKYQFKDQFADILSFVRLKDLYQIQRYGSNICMKVVEKSKSNRARSLAAVECSSCVIAIGVGAIGKKGLIALAQALTLEKLTENRKSYLDLFYNVDQKYGDLDKLLSIIGDKLSDKTREMIVDRCSKQSSTDAIDIQTIQKDGTLSRLRTPSRTSVVRTSSVSPRAINKAQERPSLPSSAETGTLKSRLQRLREGTETTDASFLHSLSRSSATVDLQMMPPPSKAVDDELYKTTLSDIRGMINRADIKSAKGRKAIHMLLLSLRNGSMDDPQLGLRQQIASDLDGCIETLTRVLAFTFQHGGKNAPLPCALIKETVDAMMYIFRTPEYSHAISQESLETTIRVTVHALLDDRLAAVGGVKADNIGTITRTINKLAMRAAMSPSRETSLSALMLLQQSTISSNEVDQPAKVSKVFTKLFGKIMKEEHEKNAGNPLGDVNLESILYSLDWLLQTMQEVRSGEAESDELLKHAGEMTKGLMVELIKCRGHSVRQALTRLELPDDGLVEKLLIECEQETALPTHPPQSVTTSVNASRSEKKKIYAVSKESRLAELLNNYAEPGEGPDRQVALVALIKFMKSNADVDLAAHLSQHTSPHFREHLLDQVRKASSENSLEGSAGNTYKQKVINSQLKVEQPLDTEQAASAASLRARLEALKR